MGLALMITVLLAMLSARYVEIPAMRRKKQGEDAVLWAVAGVKRRLGRA